MGEWISVKDRLPDAGSRVVFCDVLKAMSIGYYDSSLGFHGSVTHWMPLHDAPKQPAQDTPLTTKEALTCAISVLGKALQSTRGTRSIPIERWWDWSMEAWSLMPRLEAALNREGRDA